MDYPGSEPVDRDEVIQDGRLVVVVVDVPSIFYSDL